jgi:hypothetical protein
VNVLIGFHLRRTYQERLSASEPLGFLFTTLYNIIYNLMEYMNIVYRPGLKTKRERIKLEIDKSKKFNWDTCTDTFLPPRPLEFKDPSKIEKLKEKVLDSAKLLATATVIVALVGSCMSFPEEDQKDIVKAFAQGVVIGSVVSTASQPRR